MQAKGTFDVTLSKQPAPSGILSAQIGVMTLEKRFHGDLEASSLGQMLSVMGAVSGSAGYVAMERIIGSLDGRQGSFVLQHAGTMDRGVAKQMISVIPDSGTEALEGLSGTMAIEITGGEHFYTFDYALPDSP